MWTYFHYLYRDAGNFKVHGTIALRGQISSAEIARFEAALESSEFFIAEQVGVPPLQTHLQSEFGGRTSEDHCWHSFAGWEVVETYPVGVTCYGEIGAFVERFDQVKTWKEDLSPDFYSDLTLLQDGQP